MSDPEIRSDPDVATAQGGGLRLPRSRGAVSGVLLLLAGAWGAFAPFIGPYFHFAYTPKPSETWHWTAARGWFEVLPGGLAFFGGLLLILSANRIVTSFGAWIAALAGGWFVVGQQVSFLLTLGSPGAPAAAGDRRYVAEYLAFFTGLGAVIILFAAVAIGRLSVRSVRDVRAATRREQDALAAEQEAAEREARERDDAERADTDRAVTDRNAQTWATGDQRGGYGTPGTSDAATGPTDGSASAVTTELPVAGAAAGAGALYAGERSHDDDRGDASGSAESRDYAPYRRADADREVRPDDDTAAVPVAPEAESAAPAPVEPEPEPVSSGSTAAEPVTSEPVASEPVAPEPVAPEPVAPEPVAPEPVAPEPVAAEPVMSEPAAAQAASAEPEPAAPVESASAEPPIVLEPPEGHPDALRLRAPAEPETTPDTEPETGPLSTSGASWNPEAQSPTTTGELPAVGSNPTPPEAETPRRGVQQPRRYYAPNDPARPTGPASEGTPRDPVRTDEADDLDDMDLDERS